MYNKTEHKVFSFFILPFKSRCVLPRTPGTSFFRRFFCFLDCLRSYGAECSVIVLHMMYKVRNNLQNSDKFKNFLTDSIQIRKKISGIGGNAQNRSSKNYIVDNEIIAPNPCKYSFTVV